MADVAEAEPSPGLPAANEDPVPPRAGSELSKSDQKSSTGDSPNAKQRSFPFSRGESTKVSEGGIEKANPTSGFSQWARGFRLPSSFGASSGPSSGGEAPKASPFSMLTSGFGKRGSGKAPVAESTASDVGDSSKKTPAVIGEVQESNAFDRFANGFLDSSRNAVRSVQLKARHLVSQNKRRFQVSTSFFLY